MKIKQKIVLEVHMPCDKCKTKARMIAALTEGMISMAVHDDKNQLEIVGVGMDVVLLATTLRKKVGRTTIIRVEEVKSEEEDKKKKEADEKKKKKEEDDKKKKENKGAPKNYAPPPYAGYDTRYGAPSYPHTWFY